MNNSLNIPSTFPLKEELQTMVGQLLNLLKPDHIYLSTIRNDSTPVYSLHLILKPGNHISKEEVSSLEELKKTAPQFLIQWSTLKKLRIALAEGNLYFVRQCYFGDLIYSCSTNGKDPIPRTTFKGTSLIEIAQEKVDVEIHEMLDDFTTVYMHLEEREFSKVMFRLTQLLPMILTSIFKLQTGRCLPDIPFSSQVGCIARLSPYAEKRLQSDEKNPNELITIFENLQSGHYDPSKDKSLRKTTYRLFWLMQVIFKGFHCISKDIVSQCKTLELSRNSDKRIVQSGDNECLSFDQAFHKVLEYLQSEYQVHSIFVVDKKHHSVTKEHNFRAIKNHQHSYFTCTALLITEKKITLNPSELENQVFYNTGQQLRVFFVLQTFPTLYNEVMDGESNFPRHLIKARYRWFEADERLSKALLREPFYDFTQFTNIQKHWNERFVKANHLHLMAEMIFPEEDILAQIAVLESAMIQTCLGMLYVFWELKPSYTALPYLLNLCSHFSDFPQNMLSNASFQSHRLTYLITNGQHHLLHGSPIPVTYKDMHEAHGLCTRFMEKAQQITEDQLKLLKIKSFQPDDALLTPA